MDKRPRGITPSGMAAGGAGCVACCRPGRSLRSEAAGPGMAVPAQEIIFSVVMGTIIVTWFTGLFIVTRRLKVDN